MINVRTASLNLGISKNYETIIVKSVTGTGKTTAVASHMLKSGCTKIMSITARTTLSDQHVLSFTDSNMKNYQDPSVNLYEEDAFTICINSLLRIRDIDIAEYVIYIDEISSFLELTHNETLDNLLQELYSLLVHFVKHAKQVIVSDALITDGVFKFLEFRGVDKMIYIENSFQKYSGVPAVRIRDANLFLAELLQHCSDYSYFLYGNDSKTILNEHYQECRSVAKPEDHHKYILIDSEAKLNYIMRRSNLKVISYFSPLPLHTVLILILNYIKMCLYTSKAAPSNQVVHFSKQHVLDKSKHDFIMVRLWNINLSMIAFRM